MAQSLEEKRLELHEKLCELLGSREVYFQPPETVKMSYPSIVYDLTRTNQRFGDDCGYHRFPGYTITVIERSADVDWINRMLDAFPSYCSFERTFIAEHLVHYVFILYYL